MDERDEQRLLELANKYRSSILLTTLARLKSGAEPVNYQSFSQVYNSVAQLDESKTLTLVGMALGISGK